MPTGDNPNAKGLSYHLPVIDYVVKFVSMNCSGSMYVYIEDDALALKDVVLGLVDESPIAFLRARLRPKGQRSGGHFRRYKFEGAEEKEEETTIDFARELGKQLNVGQDLLPPTYKYGGKAMWVIADVAANVAYMVLIAGLVKKYLYESFHMLAHDPRIHCAHGWGNGAFSQQIQRATPTGNWGPILAFDTMHVGAPNFTVSDRMFAGPGKHTVYWATSVHNMDHTFPADVALRIMNPTTLEIMYETSILTLGPDEESQITIEVDNYPEGEFVLWTFQRGLDFVNFANGNMMSHYTGPGDPPPPPPEPPKKPKDDKPRGHGGQRKAKRPRKPYKLKFTKYRA